jgi:FkbM family methyltransferase
MRNRVHPSLAVRDAIARWLILHSGRRRVTKVFEPVQGLCLYALGYGSAELPVDRSGERHVLALLAKRAGAMTVFDVGAHTGSYAALAYQQLGRRARIHCFEPDLRSLEALEVSATRIPSVVVHPFGIGARNEELTLYSDAPGSPMASVNPQSLAALGRTAAYRSRVNVRTLADVCHELSIDRIDLLKIDVEGAELDVLEGARSLLGERRIRMIQFEFGYGNVASRTFLWDFHKLLRASHELHRLGPLGLMPMGTYALRHEVFVAATNYVAIERPSNASLEDQG